MWGLKIGELAIITDSVGYPDYCGEIVLGTFGPVVSLSNPKHIWAGSGDIKMRRLFPGASVTLIQE